MAECASTRVASTSITSGEAALIPAVGACSPARSHTLRHTSPRAASTAASTASTSWARVGCDHPRIHRPTGGRVGLPGYRRHESPDPASLPAGCAAPGGAGRVGLLARRSEAGGRRGRVREGFQPVAVSPGGPAADSANGARVSGAERGAGTRQRRRGCRGRVDGSEPHQQFLRPVRPDHDRCGGQL